MDSEIMIECSCKCVVPLAIEHYINGKKVLLHVCNRDYERYMDALKSENKNVD